MVEKAKCQVCHAGPPPKLGPFGQLVKANLQDKKFNAAVLEAISSSDADGDGANNLDELKAGTLPGDAASKPASEPVAAPLLPKHAFHPLIVHFPIALFMFGAFLDALGHFGRKPGLRLAALWNLCFGALAGVGGLVTGLVSRYLFAYPIEGTTLIHLVLGIAATILMVAVSLHRRKHESESVGYWVTLAVSTVCVAAAGHFGSVLVHG